MFEDTFVAGAIFTLSAIFLSAFVGLVVLCQRKYQKIRIVKSLPYCDAEELRKHLYYGFDDQIIWNVEHWKDINDPHELLPHCKRILKACHMFTQLMMAIAKLKEVQSDSCKELTRIIKNENISIYMNQLVADMKEPSLECILTDILMLKTHMSNVAKKAALLRDLAVIIPKKYEPVSKEINNTKNYIKAQIYKEDQRMKKINNQYL